MEIEAFVLIGGRSSRMGRDKALLKIDGETLTQRAVNTLGEAFPGAKISLVARDEDQFAPDVLPPGIPVICDIQKDRGAYSALHAALSTAESEWIFVLACDLPFVAVDLLKLMAGLTDGVLNAIVPVQSDRRIQPLCAFYHVKSCLKIVENMIKISEDLPPLRAVFEKINTRFVRSEIEALPNAQNFFFNLNSAEDLERINEGVFRY